MLNAFQLLRPALLILLLVTGTLSAAQETPIFPLAAVTPGLTGYAITAGPGNNLQDFNVEVIGLQVDAGVGFPLILVRTSGDFIDASGGVAAGMSGSPVYLPHNGQDALLGAIGYVFPNSDHHLALVTPIEIMQGKTVSELHYSPFYADTPHDLGTPVPVSTPVLLSGLSERASQPLQTLFSNTRVTPFVAQVGAAGGFDEDGFVLRPGSAVSVQLVRGDVTIAAVGTVTLIEGNQVLAFGHPLLGQGTVRFALAPAFVSYIVPSVVVPFKLANNGSRVLGSITQDLPAALHGQLEDAIDFLPVTLTVTGDTATVTKTFEITNDERFYAPLLASATLQIMDEATQKVGAGTVDVAWDIRLADGDNVRILEQTTSDTDIASAAARLSASPLAVLANNIFETPEISGIQINLKYSEQQRYAEVVQVIAEDDSLAANDTVIAYVRLQPYRGAPEVKTVSFTLPEDIEAGSSVDIVFRGGDSPATASNDADEEDDPILSYGELLVALRENVQASELIVETTLDGKTRRLERLSLPYMITGEQTLTIHIDGETADNTNTTPDETPDDAPEPDMPPVDDNPPLEPLIPPSE